MTQEAQKYDLKGGYTFIIIRYKRFHSIFDNILITTRLELVKVLYDDCLHSESCLKNVFTQKCVEKYSFSVV